MIGTLIIVAIISIPLISLPGDYVFGFNVKFTLCWNEIILVCSFFY